MLDDATQPYQVKPDAGRFRVLDESGRVIMVSQDEGSATEYAVLLNEAYRRGYKAGFRDARKP